MTPRRRPIPPGLTCAKCRLTFRRPAGGPALARRTPAGYEHARDRECASAPDELTPDAGHWVNVRGVARWLAV